MRPSKSKWIRSPRKNEHTEEIGWEPGSTLKSALSLTEPSWAEWSERLGPWAEEKGMPQSRPEVPRKRWCQEYQNSGNPGREKEQHWVHHLRADPSGLEPVLSLGRRLDGSKWSMYRKHWATTWIVFILLEGREQYNRVLRWLFLL